MSFLSESALTFHDNGVVLAGELATASTATKVVDTSQVLRVTNTFDFAVGGDGITFYTNGVVNRGVLATAIAVDVVDTSVDPAVTNSYSFAANRNITFYDEWGGE